jgi:hypothetical protein
VTRRPIPEVAYVLAGPAEADRLRAHGIELHGAVLSELGRAVLDHQQPADPTDPHLAHLLAQVQERNRVERQELETSPNARTADRPNILSRDLDRAEADEQTDSATRAQDRTPGRNRRPTIEDFLRESHDEHEEWS